MAKASTQISLYIDHYAAWCHANDKTFINGSKIYTGSITADKISVDSLSALCATIGGFTIGASALYSGAAFNSMNATGNGVYVGTDGIKLGSNFKVSTSGSLSSINASLQNLNLFDKITFFNAKGIPMHGSGNVAYTSLGTISVGEMISYTWAEGELITGQGCMLFSMPTRIDRSLSVQRLYADNNIQAGGSITSGGIIYCGSSIRLPINTALTSVDADGTGRKNLVWLSNSDNLMLGGGTYPPDHIYLRPVSGGDIYADGWVVCKEGITTAGKTSNTDGKVGCDLSDNGRLYLSGEGDVTPGVFFYHDGQTTAGANITYNSSTDKVNVGNSSGLTVGGTAVSLQGHEHSWTEVTITAGNGVTISSSYCAYNTAINTARLRIYLTIKPTADIAAGESITIANVSGKAVPGYLNPLTYYTGTTNARRWVVAINSDGEIIARPSTALTKGTSYGFYVGGTWSVSV